MWAFIKHVKLFCVLLLNLDMRGLKLPGSAYQRTTVSSLTVFMMSWVGFEGIVAGLKMFCTFLLGFYTMQILFGFLLCIPQCCCGFC